MAGYGKVLGAMIGGTVGVASGSALATFVLVLAGVFVGHRYDALHTPDLLQEEIPLTEEELLAPGAPGATTRARARKAPRAAPTPRAAAATPPRPRRPVARPTSTTTELPALPPRPAIHALCALFVEVARADGEVARDEVRAIREFFQEHLHFEGRGLNEVRTGLKAAIAHEPREVEAVAKALPGGGLSLSPAAVLDALYAVALSDGRMMRAEQDAIRRAARGLGVSEATQAEVATRHFGDGAIHFQALGLKVGASNDEVKSAYRRLAAEHHPDRAATRGPRAVEEASRRFQTIHEAYEEIRRLRGL